MAEESGEHARREEAGSRRSLLKRRIPDPLQAHGAWVLLVVSIVAGALAGAHEGILAALAAGLGYCGVFLCAAALPAPSAERRRRRLIVGGSLALVAPLAAIAQGGDPAFLAYGMVAVFPAAISGWLGERQGYRSAGALGFGIAAIVVAAPSAACAGGATPAKSWLLLVLLAPFFAFRALRVRRLIQEERGWTRPRLRRLGWREATLAIGWTALSVVAIHLAV